MMHRTRMPTNNVLDVSSLLAILKLLEDVGLGNGYVGGGWDGEILVAGPPPNDISCPNEFYQLVEDFGARYDRFCNCWVFETH